MLPRDAVIDTLRGVAILMVIGLHSLPKLHGSAIVTAVDAALRPCVPVFLFASGYLSAQCDRIPAAKRVLRALGPYTVAFAAAYLLMAAENPLMDHRPAIIVARYGLAYVFVYYYVFVYIGCTVLLWLSFLAAGADRQRLIAFLSFAIVIGIAIGAYLDPLLQHLGVPAAQIEEARMRDLPFWFGFMAVGAIVGCLELRQLLQNLRSSLLAATLLAYAAYASVRIFAIGDAADYDSVAFFVYACLFCLCMLAFAPRVPALGFLGAASYAIYLWHIFPIMILRGLLTPQLQPAASFFIEYVVALIFSIGLVITARSVAAPRLARWLGA
ncbi:MAG TPA: acyltransferase [Pseudolabrys sp.]|nr:acyltransferase [Pseudolabrys sp.]